MKRLKNTSTKNHLATSETECFAHLPRRILLSLIKPQKVCPIEFYQLSKERVVEPSSSASSHFPSHLATHSAEWLSCRSWMRVLCDLSYFASAVANSCTIARHSSTAFPPLLHINSASSVFPSRFCEAAIDRSCSRDFTFLAWINWATSYTERPRFRFVFLPPVRPTAFLFFPEIAFSVLGGRALLRSG